MLNQLAFTETRKPGIPGDRPTIDAVRVEWMRDESPDVSSLETDASDDYYAENVARLNAYHDGEWIMTGCRAVAIVSYPIDNQGSRRIETFTSGGLWGIESDCGEDYKREVEQEQLADLLSHLKEFHVDTAGFWNLAGVGEP